MAQPQKIWSCAFSGHFEVAQRAIFPDLFLSKIDQVFENSYIKSLDSSPHLHFGPFTCSCSPHTHLQPGSSSSKGGRRSFTGGLRLRLPLAKRHGFASFRSVPLHPRSRDASAFKSQAVLL
ncbi:unnamed protein product [Amoebophrya sp. A120]|nr:unnamed protein product [Amoebophrya sp. A120]|eukprot:GSA120T00015114001.1